MRSSLSIEKAAFVVSLMVLSMLYGVAVGRWHWTPFPFIEGAVEEVKMLVDPQGPLLNSRDHERQGVRLEQADRMAPGLTFLGSSWDGPGGLEPGLRLVDRDGTVLHEWRIERTTLFEGGRRKQPERTGIHGSSLLSGGDVVVNQRYVGMARLNSCGEVQWALDEGNHHSIAQAEDGSFWTPAVHEAPRATSERYPDGYPGLDGTPVWRERLLQVSPDGEILRDINALDLIYMSDLKRHLVKAPWGGKPRVTGPPTDILHINDVEPLPSDLADAYPLFDAGDLVVSVKRLHLVFVFDPDSMTVKWHAADPFVAQHDPDFIGDGWISVFDNQDDGTGRGSVLGGSRIVAVQPHTDSTKVLFPTEHSEPFYTPSQGRLEMLDNGNMLLTETESGRVVEVGSAGHTVWEWIHGPYDESRVPEVTQASRHDLSQEEVASWSCSSVDSAQTASRPPD
ncbi:MAG: hypothetical protein BRD27_04025 [Bacteroidetes bacterium QH_10_64_19]|nr:MAG: hypothetical protein BRD27_04025 [Bacteroidetes bacterium QH_10_64_19]